MSASDAMRKLATKWVTNRGWPQRLEWLEISGLRGWEGQRINLDFPLIAIAGENGVGKSTILQAIASLYRSPSESERSPYASQYFPDSPWDKIHDAKIAYQVKEGDGSKTGSIQKPTDRWRETPERRKRNVLFIDLKRIQALTSRLGYQRIAKALNEEDRRELLSQDSVNRLSSICGRTYDSVGRALSNIDQNRWVPIASIRGQQYSGFHHGAGELALVELLNVDFPQYSMVLIDEFETSLHPRAQRRLLREMADICRVKEIQIVLTTHSPYVLEELPPQGRMYVMNTGSGKSLMTGVSPSFALTQMDDDPHPELDIYVEDVDAKILLEEIIVATKKELIRRCEIIPFGGANVGLALGTMVYERRFTRPSIVFLDGDQEPARGCEILPGGDAPERVVFRDLRSAGWRNVPERIGRAPSETIDALEAAMTKGDHHEWVPDAADRLVVGGNELWRALSSAWVAHCADNAIIGAISDTIEARLEGIGAARGSRSIELVKPAEVGPAEEAEVVDASQPAKPQPLPPKAPKPHVDQLPLGFPDPEE